jgi:hypothetical protein
MVDWLYQEICEASEKIAELKLQTHLSKAESKVSLEGRIEILERQKKNLGNEVHSMRQSTSSSWEDKGDECKNSWFELTCSIQKAAAEFKK